MELIGLKLTTGEEVIGYLHSKLRNGALVIDRPMVVNHALENSSIALYPYASYAFGTTHKFEKKFIILTYLIRKELRPTFDRIWNYMDALLEHSLHPQPEIPQQQEPVPTRRIIEVTPVEHKHGPN